MKTYLPLGLALTLLLPSALPAETSLPKTTLWKLTGEVATVYLAGSVHLLREEDMPFPDAFEHVYRDSEEIIFEIDMAEMQSPGAGAKMRRLGALPKGQTLADHLADETIKGLEEYLKESALPPNLFNRLTPGMVYLTLGSMEAMRQGARPDLGMESQFYELSRRDKKPSRGLETIEFQISRFNDLEIETLEKLIVETLEETDENADDLNKLIEAWKLGDLTSLEELIVDKVSDFPSLTKVLLTDRNANWIPEIEKSLKKEKNVMFLVGAAHLIGEGSVIDLLEKRGYAPTQIGTNP